MSWPHTCTQHHLCLSSVVSEQASLYCRYCNNLSNIRIANIISKVITIFNPSPKNLYWDISGSILRYTQELYYFMRDENSGAFKDCDTKFEFYSLHMDVNYLATATVGAMDGHLEFMTEMQRCRFHLFILIIVIALFISIQAWQTRTATYCTTYFIINTRSLKPAKNWWIEWFTPMITILTIHYHSFFMNFT